MSACPTHGPGRVKTTTSGRTYCIPCRLAHEKRRKARRRAEVSR